MNYLVLIKMVPDTVEEIELLPNGQGIDSSLTRYKLSDPDEHAIEQALILKEKHGGNITLLSLVAPEVDDVLFTAIAKGVDRAIKINIDQTNLTTTSVASVFSLYIKQSNLLSDPATLILTGSQASDDLDGELAPIIAENLSLPVLTVVSGVTLNQNLTQLVVFKEFSGGLRGEFELSLPCVLGLQSAESPPRYVPVSKVRNVMKSSKIENVELPDFQPSQMFQIEKLYKPEISTHAEMLEGNLEEVADKIASILSQKGII